MWRQRKWDQTTMLLKVEFSRKNVVPTTGTMHRRNLKMCLHVKWYRGWIQTIFFNFVRTQKTKFNRNSYIHNGANSDERTKRQGKAHALLHNSPTPCCRVFLKKLIVAQLYKFFAFYGTGSFIACWPSCGSSRAEDERRVHTFGWNTTRKTLE
jgi:hypothetical protein